MNTINKLLACFGVKLVSDEDYHLIVERQEWAERERELLRKIHNHRCLANYHRKKAARAINDITNRKLHNAYVGCADKR